MAAHLKHTLTGVRISLERAVAVDLTVRAPRTMRPRSALPPGWQLVQCDYKGNPSPYGDYYFAEGPGGHHTDVWPHPDSAAFWARRIIQQEVADAS